MRSKIYTIFGVLLVASMLLTACAQATPAAATTITQVVKETVVVQQPGQQVVVTATAAPAQAVEFKSKDPTSYVFETFGDADTLDPALDYETAGLDVIQSTYDFLVFYNKGSVSQLVPMVATEIPTKDNGGISADGKTYTFKIRKGIKFHNGDDLTPTAVAFSFQRGLLSGGSISPQWLFAEPILGETSSYDIADQVDPDGKLGVLDSREKLLKVDPATLKTACEKVTSAITADDAAGTVTFKLAQPWGPFLVTLAGSWGAIQDPKWVAANGGWDGSCDKWQNFYAPTADELNKGKLGAGENGSGPYILDHWTPKSEIVMKANDSYWLTTPLWDGGPTGAPKLKTVTIKEVDEFSTRFAAFKAGDADQVSVGGAADWPQMDTLTGEDCTLDGKCTPSAEKPTNPIRRFIDVPQASRTDVFFNFSIASKGGNPYIGSGKLDGNGIPDNFFSDINIRKAFAYCFDQATYIKDVLQGSGKQAPTIMLPGEPGYDANNPMYTYDADKCKAAFQASTLKAADGKSLWDTGFRMSIVYNQGNTARQTVAEIFASDISAVNDKFVIETTGLPWPAFLAAQRVKQLPIFVSGWQEDIPDPQDWLFPYASASGTYSGRQSLPKDLVAMYAPFITQGATEADPAKRDAIYKQFNKAYYDTIPTLLLANPLGHHYEQRWVEGWYSNPLFGNMYYYAASKK